jgi:hypothetical protein
LAETYCKDASGEASLRVMRLNGLDGRALELRGQKIRAGQTAGEAVDDLIQRNASEIHKKLFGDDA